MTNGGVVDPERNGPHVDPLRLGVMWQRLVTIADEVGQNFVRSCFSVIVRENYDFACALMDARGRLVAQTTMSIPSFIGTIPITLGHMLRKYPASELAPGDVLITNDPWLATGQLNDYTMLAPIFRGDRLVGYVGAAAQSVDIGGALNPMARDAYEEGIRIPIAMLVQRGIENQLLFEMLEANIRSAHETIGDIRSLIGAFLVASAKVVSFLDEYDVDDLEGVTDSIVTLSEQHMRQQVLAIPDGRYLGALDADGYDAPVELRLALDVRGDSVHCDFAGSSPQLDKPINSVLNYTFAYSAYAIKCLLSPELPNNDGAIAPITVSAPEGSCLNPRYPAPTWARAMLGHYIPPLVFKALATVLPDDVCADSGSPIWTVYLRGQDARGNAAVETFFVNGGHGARAQKDGPSCLSFPSNVSNTPIEILEHRMPVLVQTKRLLPDSGGPGRTRGGLGQELSLTPLGQEPMTVVIRHERVKHPPEGLLGGLAGARGADLVNGVEVAPKGSHVIRPGDVATFRLPGGGGMHPPSERPRALVLRDLEDGLISAEQARDVYGLVEDAGVDVDSAQAPRGVDD